MTSRNLIITLLLFTCRAVMAINAPTHVSPSNGGVNISPSALLDWSAVSGNTGYLYQIDITPTFNSPQLFSGNSGVNISQATSPQLLYGTTYYWRVATMGPVDTSAWTSAWSFTTYDNVILASPNNGAVNQSINPLLDWSTASGSTNYLYQVDVSNTFNSPSLISSNTGGTTSQVTMNNLLFGTTYYWRVRAASPVDTTQWSATWSFTTYDNVILASPNNGAVNQSINPLLDWSTASGSTNYLYQVDVSNTFNSPSLISSNTGGTTSQVTMNNLLFGTTYYWRVRAASPVDTTQWSTTWSFTTYDNVTLVSPTNGAINQPINPLLDWSSASGSTNYIYQVDVNNTFNSPSLITGNTGGTTSQTSMSNLDFGTTYYWRVRAVSPVDTTQWSATWSFSTLANAVHVSPSNGAINQPINPTLDWTTVSGSISYTYQYDVTATFSSPSLVTNTISSSSSQVTLNNLQYGTTYYWRVSVTTASGTTAWTSPWSFTTYDDISLVSPSNGAINQPINPLLDWTTGTGSSSYIYQLDVTNTFNSPSLVSGNAISSQVTMSNLLFGTTYYWRVAAVSPVDTTQWSTIWSFTTYDNVTLVSPINGAINQPIDPLLDWSTGAGSTSYIYQVDVSNTFNSPSLLSGNALSSQLTMSNLLYGTTYFWRVAAVSPVDTTQWSTTWSFTTYDNITLVSPINGAINQSINPLLDWTTGSGSTSYLYEVDVTNTFNSPSLLSGNALSSQVTMNNLLYGTTYYWRVRAVSSVDTTQWSTIWSFTTYDNVTLVSPINGAINQSINPLLDWTTGAGSTSYLYEVDVTNTFNSPSLLSGNAISSQVTMSSLLYGTQYFWRVRAVSPVDTSLWSAVWSFTTAFQLTTPPTLISPVNGSTAIPLNGQNFVWNSVPTATSYALEYSQSPTFSSGITTITTGSTSAVINGLSANTTYYWRVRASNSTGYSNWSTIWNFTTANCSVATSLSASQCYSYVFNGSTLTTSGVYTATLMASSGCDSVVTLNLTILNNTLSTQNVVACVSYTVPSGDETYTVSGTYTDTLPNAFGCDSILTINLTIPVINTNVQLAGVTLTSNEVGASYQWINCAGNVPIAGATNQSFTPTANGDYAVIITKNGCTATSSCTTISTIGLSDIEAGSGISIFPNPSSGLVNVHFDDVSQIQSLSIVNPLGQLIEERTELSAQQTLLLEGTAGLYFILVTSERGEVVPFRIVKN